METIHDQYAEGYSVFVAAVEAGSFAQAAIRLHLSRRGGKSIARPEERLGVRLFHRTTRSQSLTDNGRRALPARAGGD